MLVSKNVCHSIKNTYGEYHNDSFLENYKLRDGKRLHDLLAAKEAVKLIEGKPADLAYKNVVLYDTSATDGFGRRTHWGSKLKPDSNIVISTHFIK